MTTSSSSSSGIASSLPYSSLTQQCLLFIVYLLICLLYTHTNASPLSYQQIAKLNLTGGYQDTNQFFVHQQAILSKNSTHLHYRVQCTKNRCNWQNAILGLVPKNHHIEVGYNKRFQSHALARSQPFFGLAISTPNLNAHPKSATTTMRPWLGVVLSKNSLVTIKDSSSILQQDVLSSGSHLYASQDLPTGAYPINIDTVDQTSSQNSQEQFVNNTNLDTPLRHATHLSVGFPTNRAAQQSYGLPPIDNDPYHLLVNLTHIQKTPLGSSQGTLNLQGEQLSVGFNTRSKIHALTVQPEILWMQGIFNHHDHHSLAIGFQTQASFLHHVNWNFMTTHYPSQPSKQNLPWIVHTQIQRNHHNLLSAIMLHISQNNQKNMLQAIVKKRFSHPRLTPDLSLSASARKSQSANLSLNFSIKQKSTPHMHWRVKTTNQQQTLTSSVSPKKYQKHQVSLANLSNEKPHQQRISLSTQWQDAFALWRLSGSIPLQDNHTTWAIQAKTGLLCAGSCAIWTPIHSIHTAAIIDIDPSVTARYIYWGNVSQLQQQGLNLQKKRPYTTVPSSISSKKHSQITQTTLYPGNILIS